MLAQLRAHAPQLELIEVSISNFVKFLLQSMSYKIEQAFEKKITFSIKIWLKLTLAR